MTKDVDRVFLGSTVLIYLWHTEKIHSLGVIY